jgi:hypothetical protein
MGELFDYLPEAEALSLGGAKFGAERALSKSEEANMLAAGLDRVDIADMTPERLAELAESAVEGSNNFLGA